MRGSATAAPAATGGTCRWVLAARSRAAAQRWARHLPCGPRLLPCFAPEAQPPRKARRAKARCVINARALFCEPILPPQSLPSSRVFHWVAEPLAYVMTVATAVAVYHSCADVSAAASWHGRSMAVKPRGWPCSGSLAGHSCLNFGSRFPVLTHAEHAG